MMILVLRGKNCDIIILFIPKLPEAEAQHEKTC